MRCSGRFGTLLCMDRVVTNVTRLFFAWPWALWGATAQLAIRWIERGTGSSLGLGRPGRCLGNRYVIYVVEDIPNLDVSRGLEI
jgi:hypothetical protein